MVVSDLVNIKLVIHIIHSHTIIDLKTPYLIISMINNEIASKILMVIRVIN